MRKTLILAGAFGLLATVAHAQNSLPDPQITPGALNPKVNQENIDRTICVRSWTKTIRPPVRYTERLKRVGIRQYGYSDHRLTDYEEDHLVPLELAGNPTDPRNLWPEPWNPPDGWGAALKDDLERKLNFLVCTRQIPLAEAQRAIMTNWENTYNHYVIGE